MPYEPGSRFQLVDSAVLAPGEDVLTRTTVGPFIDTGVTLNGPDMPYWRGRVYIAVDAVREMAEQAGLFDQYEDDLALLRADHEEDLAAAEQRGYDRARAEQIDQYADELVDRMRARVERPRLRRDDDPVGPEAAGDHPAAAEPAGDGAEAAGEPGRDDVPVAQPA